MPEARIDELLEQLCSRDSHEAWSAFLEQYASLILQVIRHFRGDSDDSADCFQFVCGATAGVWGRCPLPLPLRLRLSQALVGERASIGECAS